MTKKSNHQPARRTARRALLGLASAAVLVSGLGLTGAAQAQAYPNKSINIVIGFPPGGAIDTIARVLAPKMSADLGQSVVIENKPGAGGVIGMQSVARAEPDRADRPGHRQGKAGDRQWLDGDVARTARPRRGLVSHTRKRPAPHRRWRRGPLELHGSELNHVQWFGRP